MIQSKITFLSQPNVMAIDMISFKKLLSIILFATTTVIANHPSSHGHGGSHHHMHHPHHQPQLAPPTSFSAPLRQSYVHKYSYNLPGSGSHFSMTRLYNFPAGSAPQPHLGTPSPTQNVRPFLPNSVGPEAARSSSAAVFDGDTQSEIGRLKDHALLSSLNFLPDDFDLDNVDGQHQQPSNSSSQHPPSYNPFNPRYAVGRLEVTDEEWQAEMQEDFETSGLMNSRGKRGILSKVPKGLVNINFGTHTCVHMGTELRSSESAYKPTAISYPIESAETDQLHTIVMLDLDHEGAKGQTNEIETLEKNSGEPHMYLHWMVINIPGSKVEEGQTITSYKGPAPKPGSGVHRYVIVAYEQKSETPLRIDHAEAPFRTSFPCQELGRLDFNLEAFRSKYNMSEHPVAANYFNVQHDEFVENIDQSCSISEKEEVKEAVQDKTDFHSLPILNYRFL